MDGSIQEEMDNALIITLDKLKIYSKYNAIGRGYDYVPRKHLKKLSYTEFIFIERLIQDIKLVKRGLASESYSQNLNQTIQQTCNCEETINYLQLIANSY